MVKGGAECIGGIIPAYAGSTSCSSVDCSVLLDHPRVCGEHIWLMALLALDAGSSPRMRGTQDVGSRIFEVAGIIPAYAGNTR